LSKIRARFEEIKNHPYLPAGAFVAGFVFDIVTLDRADSLFQILQQAAYLAFLTWLLYAKILYEHGLITIPQKLQRIWKYHEFTVQFLLGSLLSVYTLFYIKSASILSSLIFVFLIAALLVINEFVRLKRNQIVLSLVLFFLCLASYFIYLVPTLLGFVGVFPFALALVITLGCVAFVYRIIERKFRANPEMKKMVERKIVYSGGGVIALFLVSYVLQIIPPVPVSLSYIGIFRDVHKENGQYVLSYTRPWWRFWENGDQTFYARPGDSIVAFVRVFAPTGFRDEFRIRWLLRTPRGWEKQDSIPITVAGGRDQGFRGYTVKANYQPGHYRIQVETTDAREVGRLYMDVHPDAETGPRELKELRQ